MKTIRCALVSLLLSALPVSAQDYSNEVNAYQLGLLVGQITCEAYAIGIRSNDAYTVYLATSLGDANSNRFMSYKNNSQLLALMARAVTVKMNSIEGCGQDKMRTVKGK